MRPRWCYPGSYPEDLLPRPVLPESSQTTLNTQHLLEKLDRGEIQFALIEGLFDKTAYHSELFSIEPFVGICAKHSPLADRSLSLQELTKESLIVREQGSGTREIFEHLLQKHNLSITSFSKITEIGNMEAIKQPVKRGLGVTFLYLAAARKELAEGDVKVLSLTDMSAQHELNFVFLRNSQHASKYLAWFHAFREYYESRSI